MWSPLGISSASAGMVFDRLFDGGFQITVRREGNSRVRHLFEVDGHNIARLRWRGLRRAVYEAEGSGFDIRVGALDRRIALVADDGGESIMLQRSPGCPQRERLRIEMAEGDNFCLSRSCDSRLRAEQSLLLHKQFYESPLMIFRYSTRRRTQTTVQVSVESAIKWEQRFLHRLLALGVSRIIVERRQTGLKPQRTKEETRCSAGYRQTPQRRRFGHSSPQFQLR